MYWSTFATLTSRSALPEQDRVDAGEVHVDDLPGLQGPPPARPVAVRAECGITLAVLVVEHAVLAVLVVDLVSAVGVEGIGRVPTVPARIRVDTHGPQRAAVVVDGRRVFDGLSRTGHAQHCCAGQHDAGEDGGDRPTDSVRSHDRFPPELLFRGVRCRLSR